jgi:hypothetical protein
MLDKNSSINRFINVAFQKQTYLNIIYLLFTFPLGTAYFIFLVTGLSLGLSLSVVWVGIPILILVFLAWWEIASFERQLAIWFLDVDIAPMGIEEVTGGSILDKMVQRLKNPVTWKALFFLFIKFPLGILSLVVTVLLISISLSMLLIPLAHGFRGLVWSGSNGEVLIVFILGLVITLISMHIMNFLAYESGKFAVMMLGSSAEKVSKIDNIEDADYIEIDITDY